MSTCDFSCLLLDVHNKMLLKMFVYRANRDVDREFPTYLILQDTSKRVYETPDGSDSVDELAEPLTPQHVKDLAEYKQLSTIALRHSGDISHGTHI